MKSGVGQMDLQSGDTSLEGVVEQEKGLECSIIYISLSRSQFFPLFYR
jgi:hypothetical protein